MAEGGLVTAAETTVVGDQSPMSVPLVITWKGRAFLAERADTVARPVPDSETSHTAQVEIFRSYFFLDRVVVASAAVRAAGATGCRRGSVIRIRSVGIHATSPSRSTH